jgi:hypothetical protein
LSNGDRCTIYELSDVVELERPSGEVQEQARSQLAEVVEVSGADPPDERVRGRIGSPSVGSVVDPSAVRIVGWALGHQEPAAGVEIEANGRVIWRRDLGVARWDLAEAFPDYSWAGKAGFAGDVDVLDAIGPNGRSDLDVKAILADGDRASIGTIRLRHARQ